MIDNDETTIDLKSPARLQKHLSGQKTDIVQEILRETKFFNPDNKVMIGYWHDDIPAELQSGPQCGIVALKMASHRFVKGKSISITQIQDEAISRHFSKRGEMYSAENMAILAEEVIPGVKTQTFDSNNLVSLPFMIRQLVTERNLLLVPYDSDHNHSPCLKNGHKAHWTVIIGILFFVIDADVTGFKKQNYYTLDQRLYKMKDSATNLPEFTSFFLLGRQSKSRRIMLFNPEQLMLSNKNLRESGKENDDEFAIPPGGVSEGLSHKIVLLKPNETKSASKEI